MFSHKKLSLLKWVLNIITIPRLCFCFALCFRIMANSIIDKIQRFQPKQEQRKQTEQAKHSLKLSFQLRYKSASSHTASVHHANLCAMHHRHSLTCRSQWVQNTAVTAWSKVHITHANAEYVYGASGQSSLTTSAGLPRRGRTSHACLRRWIILNKDAGDGGGVWIISSTAKSNMSD